MVEGAHGINVEMDADIDEVNFDEFDMLVCPGGMPGTRNLEACTKLTSKFVNLFSFMYVSTSTHSQSKPLFFIFVMAFCILKFK